MVYCGIGRGSLPFPKAEKTVGIAGVVRDGEVMVRRRVSKSGGKASGSFMKTVTKNLIHVGGLAWRQISEHIHS